MEQFATPHLINLDLRGAWYFLAIFRLGTFTAAAKHCKVAQPSVTGAIQRLEAAIGGKVFERSRTPTNRAVPTALAHAIKPYVEQMLLNAEGALSEAAKLGGNNVEGLGSH